MTLDSFRILQEFRCRLLILIKISLSTGAPVFFKNSGRNSAHKSSWLRLWFYKKKLSKRFSALHCTVYCTKAYHHHGYMYFQQQQRTQHQPKRSKYGKRQGHLHSDAPSHNSALHCSMTNHSDLLLTIQSTAFCDLS